MAKASSSFFSSDDVISRVASKPADNELLVASIAASDADTLVLTIASMLALSSSLDFYTFALWARFFDTRSITPSYKDSLAVTAALTTFPDYNSAFLTISSAYFSTSSTISLDLYFSSAFSAFALTDLVASSTASKTGVFG